jgi:hypothetical protein
MQLGSSKDRFHCFTRLNPCVAHCSTNSIPWVLTLKKRRVPWLRQGICPLANQYELWYENQPSTTINKIRQTQKGCIEIEEVKGFMARGKAVDYRLDEQGTLLLKDRICVPQSKEIRDSILKEAHDSLYSIHPGCTKMYQYLKARF